MISSSSSAKPDPAPSLRRSAGVVSLAIMSSRVMGLVREQVFAAMFGAGKLMDAYVAAFRIPNLLRDLFAEGALSTAFTTKFTKAWEHGGPAPAFVLANLILTAVVVLLGSICLVGILAAPWIVSVTNFGFSEVAGKMELTVRLTRILFPFIVFVSLAAVVMGMLNSRHIFGLPASASTAFNVVSIVGAVIGAYWLDPQENWRAPQFTERALDGVCAGILLGGLAQLFIQVPGLVRIGYRFCWHFDLTHPQLQEVWRLMLPSVIAGAAVQVNVLVNGMFASQIDGAASWLNFAFRLMQFPIGVFGVAIATVTLPSVARDHARADLAAFGSNVARSLRLAFFLTLPSAVGLAVLSEPIIRLIYERGQFTAADTHATAWALQAYAAGLAGYAAIKVLIPCFAALGQAGFPLRVSLVGIGINATLNAMAMGLFHWGHVGLACTTSAVALLNFLQLLAGLAQRVPLGSWQGWLDYLLRLSAATALCGGVAWGCQEALLVAGWNEGLVGQLVQVFGSIGLAAGTYVGACVLLGIEECTQVVDKVRRKLRR